MTESRTFSDESFLNRKVYYDVHEKGLIYRREHDEDFHLAWEDIQYIEDRSGVRVDIFCDAHKEVPVGYATREFPVLLKTICLKLAEIRQEHFYPIKFPVTRKHWLHVNFVFSVLVLSLLGSLLSGKVLFFTLLILFAPIGLTLQRIPLSLTLDDLGLTVQGLFLKRIVHYDKIGNIGFEIKSNDYGSTLCISIDLKNGKKIAVNKIDNIVLFFIMLQVKLNPEL